MERLLATPMTRPRLPCINVPEIAIFRPSAAAASYCIGGRALQGARNSRNCHEIRLALANKRLGCGVCAFGRVRFSIRLFQNHPAGENSMKRIALGLAAILIAGSAAVAMDPAKTMDTKAGKVWTD